MAEIDMLVMVDKDRRADLDQVAKSLEAQGFHVQQKLSRFRTIVGSGESSLLNQLQSVDGVESVRPQGTYQLPPMDEKIPQ
jgi:uncharacterized protein YcgL (UPF0745 family)